MELFLSIFLPVLFLGGLIRLLFVVFAPKTSTKRKPNKSFLTHVSNDEKGSFVKDSGYLAKELEK